MTTQLGLSYRILRLITTIVCGLTIFGGAILLVVMIGAVTGAIDGISTSIPVSIRLDESRFLLESVDQAATVTLDGIEGELDVPLAAAPAYLWVFVIGVYALMLWLITLVRDVVRSLETSPFTPKNADRITTIGWIVLGCVLIVPFLPMLTATPIDQIVRTEGLSLEAIDEVSVNLGGLMIACIILVLGQVFRYGTRLEDDARFTV